jgi:ankyrin repeat protein
VHQRREALAQLLRHCQELLHAGERGFIIDCRDADGKTALLLAVEGGFQEGVEMLLGAGADAGAGATVGRQYGGEGS